MMQELVGIVRNEGEMRRALEELATLQERAARVGVGGNREYNSGWHTALDLGNLLTVSEAVTRAAIERRESRGAHFREDCPDKDPAQGNVNIIIKKGKSGMMEVAAVPIPEMPPELKQIIEDNK
jgi:succinate dehydrogenase flavoprotein subunit